MTVTLRVLRDGTDRTLIGIPHAGGSAGSFSRLAGELPAGWRVVAGEAWHVGTVSLDRAARDWWQAVRPYVSDRSVLLGHSLGAVLVARIAEFAGDELTGTPIVLAAPPLRGDGAVRQLLATDDDAALIAGMRRLGLLPETSLTDDEIGRLLLPRFRRDVALAPDGLDRPVTLPVHVLIGAGDELCTPTAVTSRLPADLVVASRVVEGGHYFLMTEAAAAARAIVDLVAGEPGPARYCAKEASRALP